MRLFHQWFELVATVSANDSLLVARRSYFVNRKCNSRAEKLVGFEGNPNASRGGKVSKTKSPLDRIIVNKIKR